MYRVSRSGLRCRRVCSRFFFYRIVHSIVGSCISSRFASFLSSAPPAFVDILTLHRTVCPSTYTIPELPRQSPHRLRPRLRLIRRLHDPPRGRVKVFSKLAEHCADKADRVAKTVNLACQV